MTTSDSLFPLTPPASEPTSSSGSPETLKVIQLVAVGSGMPTTTSKHRSKPDFVSDRNVNAPSGSLVANPQLPEGYGNDEEDPILPRAHLPLPFVFSDNSEDESSSLRNSRRRRGGSGSRPKRTRVLSQETTISSTTTTVTRKLEHGKIRYSASVLDEMRNNHVSDDEKMLNQSANTKSQTSGRSRSPCHRSYRSAASPRRASTSKPRVELSLRSSSGARRSRRKSTSTAYPSSTAVVTRSRDSYEMMLGTDHDEHTYPGYLDLRSDLPLVRGFVNAFTFMLVSSICILTVSAVLVGSFSLTFYDDCGRRWNGMNRSLRAGARSLEGGIEGVRDGMERMLGTARGAIESAVKAVEGVAATTNGPEVQRDTLQSQHDERRNEKDVKGKRPQSRSKSGSRPGTTSEPCSTPGPSRLGRSLHAFTTLSPSSPPPAASPSLSTADEPCGSKSGWATDEDALPFEVPHSTPFTSRPVSPRRSPSPDRFHQSRFPLPDEGPASPLPPRPHLAILLPSLLFAVFLTLAKLGYSFYRASKEGQEAEKERERYRRGQRRYSERRGRTEGGSYYSSHF
ncbi:uncharacterized protein JCM15063_006318 [Sporobolomyces koalae]|uniref:uncharacterized protein n=1 Tax=Sporobolomyces koalae TaxID=500713 RepID=UPI003180B636